MDEPTSLLALAGVAALWFKQGFDRWMKHKEARRNGAGATGTFLTPMGERGALGNGAKAVAQRLDQIDRALADAKEDRGRLRDKVDEVSVRCGRLEGRLGAIK